MRHSRRQLLRDAMWLASAWPLRGLPVLAFDARRGVELQPLLAQVRRVAEAMAYLGEPLDEAALRSLRSAEESADESRVLDAIERLLAPRCLVDVRINPESRVSTSRGAAPARLVEQGWRAFLVRVRNEAGLTGRFTLESPQARPVYRPSTQNAMAPQSVPRRRRRRPLAGAADARREADGARAVRARRRVPHRASLQPRPRPARGADRRRGRNRLGRHRLQEPRGDCLHRRPVARRRAARPRRARSTDGRVVSGDGRARARLPGPQQAARARLLLSAAGLPRRRRDRPPSGRRVHRSPSDVGPSTRSEVAEGDGDGQRSRHRCDVRLDALDRSGGAGLVLGRSPRPCGRLQPLREPDRGRPSRGHDAARARRGAQRRRGAQLGPALLPPAPVLRRPGQPPVHALDAAAVRPRGVGISVEPLRAPGAVAAEGTGLSRRRGRSRTGRRGTCRS